MVITSSLPWGFYAGKYYSPIRTVIPFFRYTIDKYILRNPKPIYKHPAQVFIDEPELRNLAIPQSKGGPGNQKVFVVEGMALLISMILVSLPFTPLQFIGFVISLSSTFAYILLVERFDNIPIVQQNIGQFAHCLVAFLGFLTIII